MFSTTPATATRRRTGRSARPTTNGAGCLSAEAFAVTRQAGTERPFSSEMCSLFKPGIYQCVCCETVLFDAEGKFESGTGWPSFTQPAAANVIAYRTDESHGMTRVEAICNVCDAHLGHVFPDGPPPSGLRYCMNAVGIEEQGRVTTTGSHSIAARA